MPIYVFECKECQERFDKLMSMSYKENPKCPKCDGCSKQLVSSANVHYKGSGFYSTDYKDGMK